MPDSISCVIVDDNQVDRLLIQSYLASHPFTFLLGAFKSAKEALECIRSKRPDCIFLDIDLPGINGLDLRRQLTFVPACIFITAYPDYAVEGFETAALDFLVKPVSPARFDASISRLKEYITTKRKADMLSHTLNAETIFIKDGREQFQIALNDIIYLEALNNYTGIMTSRGKYTVLAPISTLLKKKHFRQFVRIHRSYAVPKSHIRKISADEVEIGDGTALPLGRTYKKDLSRLTNQSG